MTERATLEALLARVSAGTGPDRELDAEIARALGWKPLYRDDYSKWWPPSAVTDARERKRSILHHPTQPLPMFTASLDAALTLVPEGWSWHAALRTYLTPFRATGSVWQEGQQYALFNADAATPARALIAACLKARMEALGE